MGRRIRQRKQAQQTALDSLSLAFVLLLFLSVGCMKPQPEHILKQQEEIAKQIAKQNEENFVLSLLPPDSIVIETLGYWHVVEIKINEQPRRFLFKYWYGSHGEIGMNLTELSDLR